MKIKLIVVLIAAVTIFDSCKKGVNDPLISLKCRKARVVGEWKATSVISNNSNTFGSVTTTSTYSYSNGTWSFTGGSTQTGIGSYDVIFEKNGTYIMTTVIEDDRTVVEGTWNFSGKVGDDKNKDHLILKTTKQTFTNSNGVEVDSYDTNVFDGSFYLDELGSKKMVWKITSSNVDSYTPQGGTTTSSSNTSDMVYTWELI